MKYLLAILLSGPLMLLVFYFIVFWLCREDPQNKQAQKNPSQIDDVK